MHAVVVVVVVVVVVHGALCLPLDDPTYEV
jgi:hypothetical protein